MKASSATKQRGFGIRISK